MSIKVVNRNMKVEDVVQILNTDPTYTSYHEIFKIMGLKDPEKDHEVDTGRTEWKEEKWTVFAIHTRADKRFVALRNNDTKHEVVMADHPEYRKYYKIIPPIQPYTISVLVEHPRPVCETLEEISKRKFPSMMYSKVGPDSQSVIDDCIQQQIAQFWYWFRQMDDFIIKSLSFADVMKAYAESKKTIS